MATPAGAAAAGVSLARAAVACATAACAVVGGATPAGASPASAASSPTTQVVQGEVLRLVSEADWAAASDLRPGHAVRWDVTVSADAPDPGVVRIGISAVGDADLVVDVQRCSQEFGENGCGGEATALRSAWPLPRDGVEVALAEMADTEVAYLRLDVALDGADIGSTDVRVHARGAGESAVVGPGGGLAVTGPSAVHPWVFAGGFALVSGVALVGGSALAADRRRRRRSGAP